MLTKLLGEARFKARDRRGNRAYQRLYVDYSVRPKDREEKAIGRIAAFRKVYRHLRGWVAARLPSSPSYYSRRPVQYSGLKSKWWIDSMKRTVRVFERITTLLVIAPPEKNRTPCR